MAVRLDEWVMRTEAWCNLSLEGRAALLELLRVHDGQNNGSIGMSGRDLAARLNVSRNFGFKLLAELEEKGFIRVTVKGAFGWKRGEATRWRLTLFGTKAEYKPTADFARWKPAEKFKNRSHEKGLNGPSGRDDELAVVPQYDTDSAARSDDEVEVLGADSTLGKDSLTIHHPSAQKTAGDGWGDYSRRFIARQQRRPLSEGGIDEKTVTSS